MQKLAIVKGSGQTAPSSRTGGKGKAAGNTPKTAKHKTQFTEILGQMASIMQPMQPVNTGLIKQSGNSPADTGLNHVKAAPANAGGIATRGKVSGSAPGKAESSLAQVNRQSAQQAEKGNAAETAGAGTTLEYPRQLANSNNLLPGREKTGRTGKSDQVSTVAKGLGEMMPAVLTGEESKSSNSGEIKVADLVAKSRVKSPANRSDRAASQKSELAPETSSSVKSGRFDYTAVNQGETTHSPNPESGSEATGKQTPINKVEISLNAGGNGLVKAEAAEPNVMNAGKTILSQSQTDYLVSKMIQQINVAPSSLEVSLKPEYLGKVSILIHALEGAVAVNVIAQNSEAAHLLNSNLHHIRNNLEQQGINVQQMEVNLAFQEKQDHHQGGGYKGERRIVQETESLGTGMDYGSIPYPEQGSTSSYQLNLLA